MNGNSMELTKTKQIYEYISNYHDEFSRSPTVREIQNGCKLSSLSVVSYHLKILKRQKRIDYIPKTARGIIIKNNDFPIRTIPVIGYIENSKVRSSIWHGLRN